MHMRAYVCVHTHTHTHKHLTYTCIDFCIKVLKDAEAQLLLATQERSYYKGLIEKAKAVMEQDFTVDGELKPPCLNACLSPGTNKITVHYSFDMAQQVGMNKNCFIAYQLFNHRSTIHRTRSSQDLCTF